MGVIVEACWKGYRQAGLKKKGDRMVPNCVPISEDINIPINVGDTLLGGKFKNKRIVVKSIDKNEKGDITINGKPLLKFRMIQEGEDVIGICEMGCGPRRKGESDADYKRRCGGRYTYAFPLYMTSKAEEPKEEPTTPPSDSEPPAEAPAETPPGGIGEEVLNENIIVNILIKAIASAGVVVVRAFLGMFIDRVINGAIRTYQDIKDIVAPEPYIKFLKRLEKNDTFNKQFIEFAIQNRKGNTLIGNSWMEKITTLPAFVEEFDKFTKEEGIDGYDKTRLSAVIKKSMWDAYLRNWRGIYKTLKKKYPQFAKELPEGKLNETPPGGIGEANAVSGSKIHKFITGKNLTLKGKKYPDIEFEVVSTDNKSELVKLRVLSPKNLFGQELNVPFKTIRRGPFIKTQTGGVIEASKARNEDWSDKYKRSIDCNNPKGFSQKAHCQGKSKKESILENSLSDLEKKLKSHDWWYAYSDDNRKYTSGQINWFEIIKIIKGMKGNKEAEKLWNKYVPKDFNYSFKSISEQTNEDLRKWFGKGKTGSSGGGGWDRYGSDGQKLGKCGDGDEGDAYAACLSKEKAAKLGPEGRAAFVRRKRADQKKAGDSKKGGEQSKGQKPTLSKTGA